MPNTLAHLGLQAIATRTFIRHADPKWIFAGCILPDVPWILQRAVKTLAPAVDPYALRLYCIVQSSLAGCLLLCAALAFFAARPRQIFAVLAVNSFLHLLLDAFQTKFANGVHLFAPFSWELLNFGLFWPESWITYVLTIFGLAYVIWCRKGRQAGSTGFSLAHRGRLVLGGVLVVAYLVLPFAFPGHSRPIIIRSRLSRNARRDRDAVWSSIAVTMSIA